VQVKLWGVRGSVAVPDRRMMGYGGNTACVEVKLSDGSEIVLDAGTGIRGLSADSGRETGRIHVLLTHLHLDHIQGLLFFAPLFDPHVEVVVYGPPSAGGGLGQRLARYLSAPLSPVELRELPANVSFGACPDEEWEIGSARLRASTVHHRGVTVGYRISENGRTLCYIPDHEPALGASIDASEPEWLSGYTLAHDASVLIHDGQYTGAEYDQRVGWGHSRIEDAVAYAARVGAQRTLLFHHDPDHDDDTLAALESEARAHTAARGGDPDALEFAREQSVVEL
jgi:phosphoribosyl 1,2-cyclic phosphodiesterase